MMAYTDLTTLAAVRQWLTPGSGSLPAGDDTLLSSLITAASGWIQFWLNRDILSTDYQEIRDTYGPVSPKFVFANFPVSAVLSVVLNGVIIPPIPAVTPSLTGAPVATFPGGPGGYMFTPTALLIRGYIIPWMRMSLQLTYTAGYQTVPPEVAQACVEMVAERYRVQRNRSGVVSEVSQPSTTVTFSQKDMTANVATILSKYKAVAPVSTFSRVLAPDQTNTAILAAAI
jgi:hypothetical protein